MPDISQTPPNLEKPFRRSPPPCHGLIPDTISGLVRAASADDPDARNEIARLYRGPVLFWLAGHGCPSELAEDLTQEFLAALVNEKTGFIRHYDPAKARLRTYLKVAARNLLGSHRTKMNTKKRGGRIPHLSLDLVGKLEGDLEDKPHTVSGSGLDYAWAQTLHDAVCQQLENEWKSDPKRYEIYQALAPSLLDPCGNPDYKALANRFLVQQAALRTHFSRLKQKFLKYWTSEVRRIVTDPAEVTAESQYLLGLLIHRERAEAPPHGPPISESNSPH